MGRDIALLGEALINLSAFSAPLLRVSASAQMKIHADFKSKQRFTSRTNLIEAEFCSRAYCEKLFNRSTGLKK